MVGEALRRRVIVVAEGAVLGVLDCVSRAQRVSNNAYGRVSVRRAQNLEQPIIASWTAMTTSSCRP